VESYKIIHQFTLSTHFSIQGCYLVDKLHATGERADVFSHNTITVHFHLGDDLCKASNGFCNKTVKYYGSMGSLKELVLTEFD
jgi:hypothetical protein